MSSVGGSYGIHMMAIQRNVNIGFGVITHTSVFKYVFILWQCIGAICFKKVSLFGLFPVNQDPGANPLINCLYLQLPPSYRIDMCLFTKSP